MIKSRIRPQSDKPRIHNLPIRFSEDEYKSLMDAASKKGLSTSTFIAMVALKAANKVLEKDKQP